MFYKMYLYLTYFLERQKLSRSVRTTYNKRYKERIMCPQEYREIFEFPKRIKNLNHAKAPKNLNINIV
jgi:hypothetical protein